MVSLFSDLARARLNVDLPPYDAMGGDEKDWPQTGQGRGVELPGLQGL